MSEQTRWSNLAFRGDTTSSADAKPYVFALAHLLHIGARMAIKILLECPSVSEFRSLSSSAELGLRAILRDRADAVLTTNWDDLLEVAHREIARHSELGIETISIQQSDYPHLLRLIPDPPLTLFVKGMSSTVLSKAGVAVVGTRNTTPVGEMVAKKVSRFFGENGFSVISGLARGIDAAAHEGALDSGATTIAVFATPLDKVYPAENRDLAYRILDQGGAWVGELPLFKSAHRNSFVERDRIQSGLSVAVVPVQTDIKGGTMHTVGFAEKQHRMLLCPRPLQAEQFRDQYRGVKHLIETGRALAFDSADYIDILNKVRRHLADFDAPPSVQEHPNQAPMRLQSQEEQLKFEMTSSASDAPIGWTGKEISKLSKTLRTALRSATTDEFDELIGLIRAQLFENLKEKPRAVAGNSK
jgi:DNA processing protein